MPASSSFRGGEGGYFFFRRCLAEVKTPSMVAQLTAWREQTTSAGNGMRLFFANLTSWCWPTNRPAATAKQARTPTKLKFFFMGSFCLLFNSAPARGRLFSLSPDQRCRRSSIRHIYSRPCEETKASDRDIHETSWHKHLDAPV